MAKDPYRYFRVEARELLEGLGRGVLELERGPAVPDKVALLLRLAHTLKGAARVVKQPEIAELAHAVEAGLASRRAGGDPLAPGEASALLALLDAATAKLRQLDGEPAEARAAPASPPVTDPANTLRVELADVEQLQRAVSQAAVHLAAVRRGLGALARLGGPAASEQHGALSADVERVESELLELSDRAHRLRLSPAQALFPTLERAARDAAQELGKQVDIATAGGDVRLEANVLAVLSDALLHAVRNAVAHGVEAPAAREAAGKPARAVVRVAFERRGHRVRVTCTDDGAGIDLAAVRRAAADQGLAPPAEAAGWTADQTLAVLARGGLTTARAVTELSGRGIGLDVVRAAAVTLGGTVKLTSRPGHGTTVEVDVPVSVASLQAIVVEAGGHVAALPLAAVKRTGRASAADVAVSASGSVLVQTGEAVPFVALQTVLRRGERAQPRGTFTAVLLETREGRLAVGVDRLVGAESVVMRPLPAVMRADAAIAGAWFDSEGNPRLVLDPDGVLAAAHALRGAGSIAEPQRPAPVLVIDDSLTTRMLEQSILESAGYQVELAVSAEDGLAKARERRYSLFVVDVEMPGMNGFEFAAQARADAQLQQIPLILVTSRNAPEDKRRGDQVGARAYIVKSEFDQVRLLETIRGLIG